MTRFEFEQLSQVQQIRTISQYGEYIAERLVAGNRLYLYVVNSFYVELLHELSNIHCQGLVVARVLDEAREYTRPRLKLFDIRYVHQDTSEQQVSP